MKPTTPELIAGVDEVGRGAWAGPLVAGAVILAKKRINTIRDSKLLGPKRRRIMAQKIKRRAKAWSVGVVQTKELNKLGLSRAIRLAQLRAVRNLNIRPTFIVCDGIGRHHVDRIKTEYIIKADQTIRAVSAASIIAKVHRDRLMIRMAKQYPRYLFDRNKGYGTNDHHQALRAHGICPEHRTFYKPIAHLA